MIHSFAIAYIATVFLILLRLAVEGARVVAFGEDRSDVAGSLWLIASCLILAASGGIAIYSLCS